MRVKQCLGYIQEMLNLIVSKTSSRKQESKGLSQSISSELTKLDFSHQLLVI